MKKYFLRICLFTMVAVAATGCKKYLDINTDSDTPQNPDATSVFPTQLAGIPRGTQYDSRYLAKYIQNWLTGGANNGDTWDLHGYASGSDAAGDIWRQTYYGLGKNLEYVISESERQERWDIAGAGLALKCLMFQMATDYHGEIAFYDLYDDEKVFYKYTSQDTVYKAVDSMALKAIGYLERPVRTDLGFQPLSRGDYSFNGDVVKWKKFVWGIRAMAWNHLSNKATYQPDSVIAFTDRSMSDINGGDDFVVPFAATKNDDANFYGPYRDNLVTSGVSWKASNFVVKLLDGTTLVGNNNFAARDPRMRHMISMSADSTGTTNGGYRGVDPGIGDANSATTTGATSRRRVAGLWGDSTYSNPSAAVFNTSSGKYLFKDKAVHPVMTYSMIQFIRAEAYMKKGDRANALTAYRNGVRGHMNFVNRDNWPLTNSPLYNNSQKISEAEITNYMNTSGAVKTTAATLTLSDIMLQKYIALWGWGFVETWCDLRRYHYNVDLDPATNLPVYKNFAFGAFASANGGKPAQRVRPRFNSEYVWNIPELTRIGALANNYHTKPMWFSEP